MKCGKYLLRASTQKLCSRGCLWGWHLTLVMCKRNYLAPPDSGKPSDVHITGPGIARTAWLSPFIAECELGRKGITLGWCLMRQPTKSPPSPHPTLHSLNSPFCSHRATMLSQHTPACLPTPPHPTPRLSAFSWATWCGTHTHHRAQCRIFSLSGSLLTTPKWIWASQLLKGYTEDTALACL